MARSDDTFEVVLAVAEGPIEGLVDGAKSLKLGDTAMQNASGELNFPDTYFVPYYGSASGQEIKPKLGGFASSVTVNAPLKYNEPVTRTGVQSKIDALEVRINIQSLFKQKDDGLKETSLDLKVEYKPTSSRTWTALGKTEVRAQIQGGFVKEIRWNVPQIPGTYDIRVTKTDPQETDDNRTAVCSWESFQEVSRKSLKYDNLALVQIVGQGSENLTSLGDFSGEYYLRKVRVPSNYNGKTRSYFGTWNGLFKPALEWTDDPAWILYDFVTDSRFGLSAFHPIAMDRWACYEASQWCSQRVPDGKGGRHPRFSFNGIFTEEVEGREFAEFLAGTFNARFIDDGNGYATIKIDKPDPATHLFTPENVAEGAFEYGFTDIFTRFNHVEVSYTEPSEDWETSDVTVEDKPFIARYGQTPRRIQYVGCTNRQQALRKARYELITSSTEVTTVKFRTNRLAHAVDIWDVILIGDDGLNHGVSGRLVARTDDAGLRFLARDPIWLEAGIAYTIQVTTPNPRYPNNSSEPFIVVERKVAGSQPRSAYTNEIHISSAIDDLPPNAVFAVSQVRGGIGLPKPFRVVRVAETEGDPDLYEIEALEINRDKWAYIDNAAPITVPDYGEGTKATVAPPTNLKITVEVERVDGVEKPALVLRWKRPTSGMVTRYIVRVGRDGGAAYEAGQTNQLIFKLYDPPTGAWRFEIISTNQFNMRSLPLVGTFNVAADTRVVPPVTNLRARKGAFDEANLDIAWTHNDPFFLHYKVEWINPLTDVVGYTEFVKVKQALLENDRNASIFGGSPKRSVKVRVTAYDKALNASVPTIRTFTNAAPAVPTDIFISGGVGGFGISFNPSADKDIRGYVVWGAKGSTVSAVNANVVYRGPSNFYRHEASGEWAFRVAAYDAFDGDLNISGVIKQNSVSNEVLDGSITAAKLADSVIDDPRKIAPGVITRDKIAANTLTAREMAIGDFTNFCPKGKLRDTLFDGWGERYGVVAIDGGGPTAGSNAVVLTGNTAGGSIIRCSSEVFDVDPGNQIWTSFQIAADSGTFKSNDFMLGVRWSMGDNVGDLFTTYYSTPTASWETVERVFTVPAKAVGARFYFNLAQQEAGEPVQKVRLANIQMRRVSESVLIKDGAITSEKVATYAVSARHIQSDAVFARMIAANQIDAKHIKAGAITADNAIIANAAIKRAHIGELQVDTSNINFGAITRQHTSIVYEKLETSSAETSPFSDRTLIGFTTSSKGTGRIGLFVSSYPGREFVTDYPYSRIDRGATNSSTIYSQMYVKRNGTILRDSGLISEQDSNTLRVRFPSTFMIVDDVTPGSYVSYAIGSYSYLNRDLGRQHFFFTPKMAVLAMEIHR